MAPAQSSVPRARRALRECMPLLLQLNPSEEVKAGMDHMWASLLGRFPAKRRQWGALTAAQLK